MGQNVVQYLRRLERQIPQEVFLDPHGHDQTASVSIAAENRSNPDEGYIELPAGQVYSKYRGDDSYDELHYPCAEDEVQSGMSSSQVVPVANALQFFAGDYLEHVSTGDYYLIESVDLDNDEVTIDTAVSFSEGDAVEVDPGQSFAEADGAQTDVNTISVTDASVYEVGQSVAIPAQDVTGREVTAIDTGANTITIDGAVVSPDDGDLIVGAALGEYKIGIDTTELYDRASLRTYQNVLMRYQSRGRVREANLRGLTATARAALSPLIEFDQSTN